MGTDWVSVDELAAALGGYTTSMLSHLTADGVLEKPEMVLGSDRRWRRHWPRAYIDRLLEDPPPRLARRVALARAASAP
jgi:hypothetical protein